jgi:hypothetical protein
MALALQELSRPGTISTRHCTAARQWALGNLQELVRRELLLNNLKAGPLDVGRL